MWDKKNINSKEIDKVMDTKVEIERQVKERNINNFIKKEHDRSLKSPITTSRYKRRNKISWK